MKNSIRNLKNVKAAMIAFMMCIAIGNNAFAQTLVTPSNAASTIATNVATFTDVNSAMIQASTTGAGVATQIIAVVYYNSSTNASALYIEDITSGITSSALSLSGTPVAAPDVIICNNTSGGGFGVDDYIIAVSYPTSSTIIVDCYDLNDGSTVTMPSGIATSKTTGLSGSSTAAHIDGVVDYSNTGSTGYPLCQDAFVAWDDNGGSPAGIFASQMNISSPGFSAQMIQSSTGRTVGTPDVAGIMMDTTSGISPAEVADICYMTPGTHNIVAIRQWDYTNSHVRPETVVGSVGHVTSALTVPRIDAMDDYNNNATASGHANFKIAAQVFDSTSGDYVIRTYDNKAPGTAGWEPSDVVSTTYNHYSPSVAMSGPAPGCCGGDGTQYMITQFSDDGSGHDVVYMEPIDYGTYNALASPNDYFWVSQYPTGTSTGGAYASSVSSDCNDIPNCGLVVWAYPLGGGGTVDIYYKITTYSPYGFKHGAETGINSTVMLPDEVYPNPASNYLTIKSASGGNTAYTITDMAGRMKLQGSVQGSYGKVDINGLATGNYIIKMYDNNGSTGTEMFVRE